MRPEDILSAYSVNSLRTIARTRRFNIQHGRRPELIAALAERLFDPPALRHTITNLSSNERAALQTVVDHGGRVPSDALAHSLLVSGVAERNGPIRRRETIDRIAPTTRQFDELCARLTAQGLLFSEPKQEGTLAEPHDLSPGAVVFVPGPVFEAINQAPVDPIDSAPTVVSGGRVIVQPSLSVLVLPPLDQATLQRLDQIAERVQVAEVAEFRLTQSALLRSVEAGTSVAATIAWLEQRSEAPLPQNVHYTLNAWARSFDQIRVFHSAALLEGTAETIDHIVADATFAPLIIRRIGSHRLLLRDAAAAERVLALLNEIPRTIRSDQPNTPSFTVASDGTITLDPSFSMLLLLTLRRLAEQIDDHTFRLVQDRIRQAVATSPDGVTGVLKWLRTHGGDLPTELVTRLRAWSLPPDAVTLDQPLLLHLPAELLDDLRASPELAALLNNEYQPQGKVVRIAPERIGELIAALKEYSVSAIDL